MTTVNARSRAEELLQNLQKRAKDLLEAEDGVAKTIRALMEEKGLAPAEVQKKLEEVVGRIKATKIWDRVKSADALAFLSDYRDEMERKVEDTMHRLIHALSLVSKNELADLARQVATLRERVDALSKKPDSSNHPQ
jgi:polyhydroxyalkanoate synthesis regulator phasin